MFPPRKLAIKLNSEIGLWTWMTKGLPTKGIVSAEWGFFVWNNHDWTFRRIEWHLPCVLPCFQSLKIFLQGVHVLFFCDRCVYQTIVCEKPRRTFYVLRKIIYVRQEQERSKNRALWYARQHLFFWRNASFTGHPLYPVCEKVPDPFL